MTFNTCKCQEIFRNRYIDANGVAFGSYGGGKKIKGMSVDFSDLAQYNQEKNTDISTFYYKSLLSLSEGIACVSRKNYTWATIKLYYSTYFGLRASLLSRNYVVVRANRHLYYFEIKPGATFLSPNENTDHGATIEIYSKIFGSSDFMCKDEIDGLSLLQWLRYCREIVNYKDEKFYDPDVSTLWKFIDKQINNVSIKTLIDEFINKKQESCTSEETAILAIPVNRILTAAQEMRNNGLNNIISNTQKNWIREIIKDVVDESFLEQILL